MARAVEQLREGFPDAGMKLLYDRLSDEPDDFVLTLVVWTDMSVEEAARRLNAFMWSWCADVPAAAGKLTFSLAFSS